MSLTIQESNFTDLPINFFFLEKILFLEIISGFTKILENIFFIYLNIFFIRTWSTRPWQLCVCDTSSSQDKTSRWRCDAMVTRVSDQLRRPSGFQSFTWAHSSILYTGTPVQYTLYNTHVLHCTPAPCPCHSQLIFWLRKSNEINLSRHHWKCFFSRDKKHHFVGFADFSMPMSA